MQLFHIRKINRNKECSWTKEEEAILISHTKVNKKNHWKEISTIIPGKTPYQCYLRFRSRHPQLKKGWWSKSEDDRIKIGVEVYGRHWALIAKNLFANRNAKQIRDRYINYLDPSVNKGKFSLSEDIIIFDLYNTYGPKWSLIQKHLKNRSSDAIKNRYNSSIKRNRQMHELIKVLDENNKVKYFLFRPPMRHHMFVIS
jgi:hypothetical protein